MKMDVASLMGFAEMAEIFGKLSATLIEERRCSLDFVMDEDGEVTMALRRGCDRHETSSEGTEPDTETDVKKFLASIAGHERIATDYDTEPFA